MDRDKHNHAQAVGRCHYCGRGLRNIHGKPTDGKKKSIRDKTQLFQSNPDYGV